MTGLSLLSQHRFRNELCQRRATGGTYLGEKGKNKKLVPPFRILTLTPNQTQHPQCWESPSPVPSRPVFPYCLHYSVPWEANER